MAHTAAAGAKGCGKKRKPVTAKLREGKLREGDTRRHLQGLQGDTRTRQPKPREPETKLREAQTGCTPKATRPSPTAKGIRVPKDRAWTRFFSFFGFSRARSKQRGVACVCVWVGFADDLWVVLMSVLRFVLIGLSRVTCLDRSRVFLFALS
jgi:hypothetical protein